MSDYTRVQRATSLSRAGFSLRSLNLLETPSGSWLASVVRPEHNHRHFLQAPASHLSRGPLQTSLPVCTAFCQTTFATIIIPLLHASATTTHTHLQNNMLHYFSYLRGVDATSDLHRHVTSELLALQLWERDAYGAGSLSHGGHTAVGHWTRL